MRQFDTPYGEAATGRIRPAAIELDRAGLGKYRHLASNPIYYRDALQYCGGGIYRAACGYDVLWDTKAEASLSLCLDFFLTDCRDGKTYYFEEIKVIKAVRIHGVRWHRQIAPKPLYFDLQHSYDLVEGESLTARVNLLDKPNHVDIERSNGDVFTLQYIRYQNLLVNCLRRKGKPNDKNPKSTRTTKASSKSKTTSLSVVRDLIKEDASRPLFKKLSYLR